MKHTIDMEAFAKTIMPEIEKVITRELNRMVNGGRRNQRKEVNSEYLLNKIMNAKTFKDARYADALKLGYMPHGKLLGLSKMTADGFAGVIESMIADGTIEKIDCRNIGIRYICYQSLV